MNIFDDLKSRGLIKQVTNETEVKKLLDTEVTFYIGIDPTANSLHIGHILPLIFARRLAAHGHKPIILVGGATAKIGAPTGKR
ncbi:MAG: hypothetical protein LC122_11655 [Chitinophagales bacterium]|nr:hypothetical protein [Chitinophagales bacterium]